MKQRNLFERVRFRIFNTAQVDLVSPLRKLFLRWRGAHIGRGVTMPRVVMTWPHQVWIGDNCVLEADIRFHHIGCLQSGPNLIIGDRTFIGYRCEFITKDGVQIGNDCLFAAGCKFVDTSHEIADIDKPINVQSCFGDRITIEDDVWFGANVIVLPKVTVGRGAVVGAGAVVTKSIPPYEIWAGVPAKKIGERTGRVARSEIL